jgi:hypothetical protein
MKKITAVLLTLILLCACLAGCGNSAVFDPGNFKFYHIHTFTYTDKHCFTVEKWWDIATGIEVKTKENGTLYFSEGNYVLVENAESCPYCGER